MRAVNSARPPLASIAIRKNTGPGFPQRIPAADPSAVESQKADAIFA
jgi:hypothetical protein